MSIRQELAQKTVGVLASGSFAAFDPGETTGVAYLRDGLLRTAASLTQSELQTWLKQMSPDKWELAVYEKFLLYPDAAQRLVTNEAKAAESIGIIKTYVPVELIKVQTASDIKGRDYSPETALVTAGYSGGRLDRHQRDALSHLFSYARRQLAKANKTWKRQ